jgi:heme exporter protein D
MSALHLAPLHWDAGKYAAYLWPAYGISLIVLGGVVIESLAAARRWRRRAESLAARDIPAERAE